MKWFLLIVFLPFFATAQTVHVDDDKIEYKDDIRVEGLSAGEIYSRATWALQEIFGAGIGAEKSEKKIRVPAQLRLKTPYAIIRTVDYTIEFEVEDGKLEYELDDFFLNEKRRGFDTKRTPAKDLIDRLEEGGAVVLETEKILNEIDMKLQKKLALLKQHLKAPAGGR